MPATAATTHYVNLNSPAPSSPYTDWSTAATNIQDAIVAADPGDLVLVTNGLYQTGGALAGKLYISNRLAIVKPITVQSVNGPGVTVILGSRSDSRLGIPYVRCAFLTNGATLIGFTLTNWSLLPHQLSRAVPPTPISVLLYPALPPSPTAFSPPLRLLRRRRVWAHP